MVKIGDLLPVYIVRERCALSQNRDSTDHDDDQSHRGELTDLSQNHMLVVLWKGCRLKTEAEKLN